MLRGVDVTLFATLDSITTATLDGVCATGYAETPAMDGRIWEALHVAHALARSGEFDLVHNHLDWLPLAFADLFRAPLLTTIHGFSGRAHSARLFERALFGLRVDLECRPRAGARLRGDRPSRHRPGRNCRSQRRPGRRWSRSAESTPDKGTAAAIEIARRAGRRLVHLRDRSGRGATSSEQVEPHIDGDRVTYLGSVGPERRAEVLGAAAALLHPIAFAEPFGLSVVEAMACGTPVIAYPRGSMPELVTPGVTGFLVDGVQAAAALRR